MLRLIHVFWAIVRFSAGPQDLPYSVGLMRVVLVINWLCAYAVLQISPDGTSLLRVLTETALSVAYIWPLLYFAGFGNRFTQTWTAWLASDALINLIAIAPLYWQVTQPSNWNSLLLLGLSLWNLAVYGHIFRQALGRGWGLSIGLALFYMMLSMQIMTQLFSAMPNPAQ